MTDRKRYFTMGNALVVGLIERMSHRIAEVHEQEDDQNILQEAIQMQLLGTYNNFK
jgi:DNA (cytosine-5)-methyltransferase 1